MLIFVGLCYCFQALPFINRVEDQVEEFPRDLDESSAPNRLIWWLSLESLTWSGWNVGSQDGELGSDVRAVLKGLILRGYMVSAKVVEWGLISRRPSGGVLMTFPSSYARVMT